MKKIFILKETKKLMKLRDDYYQDLMMILKKKNPHAESLHEDKELYQLSFLAALIKLGEI